jgi:TRAP-type C4-dicarboxylate transport system permease small subunit
MNQRLGILEWAVAACLTVLVVIVFGQVVLRYLTYQPLAWTEEVARYFFVWLSLLGAVVAARRGQHFAVDTLQNSLSPRFARGVTIAIHFVEAAFYTVLTVAGAMTVLFVHGQRSPTLDLPMSLPYLAIPVGAFLMAAIALRRAWAVWAQARS